MQYGQAAPSPDPDKPWRYQTDGSPYSYFECSLDRPGFSGKATRVGFEVKKMARKSVLPVFWQGYSWLKEAEMKTRLEEHYLTAVRPALVEKFGIKTHAGATIEKVVINMGVGEALFVIQRRLNMRLVI
jgi:hypothetical protein